MILIGKCLNIKGNSLCISTNLLPSSAFLSSISNCIQLKFSLSIQLYTDVCTSLFSLLHTFYQCSYQCDSL